MQTDTHNRQSLKEEEARTLASPRRRYGCFDSLADLFRNIGLDERMHKEESLAHIVKANARFR